MREELDIGEVIQNLLQEERNIINNFEKTEIEAEKIRKNIDKECSELLEREKKKTSKKVDEYLQEVQKKANEKAKLIIEDEIRKTKRFEANVKKNKKTVVESSLEQIISEVENVLSSNI